MLCETCPTILKVCEDPYLWNLLLQKDYKFIVSNNNFNNPKQVYEIIYKIYGKQFSIGSDLLEKLFIQTILFQDLEFIEILFKRFFNTINRLGDKFLLNLFKKSLETGNFIMIYFLLEQLPQNINFENFITNELIFDLIKLDLIDIVDYLLLKFDKFIRTDVINYKLIANVMKLGLIEEAEYLFRKRIIYKVILHPCSDYEIILESYYKYKDNPFSKNIFNYILEDKNIGDSVIIKYAIINNDIDTVMLFFNEINKKHIFLTSVRYCNIFIINEILNNFSLEELEEETIEDAIFLIRNCPDILQLLLDSKKYNPDRLIHVIIETQLYKDYSLPILKYILTNFNLDNDILNYFLVKSAKYCYLVFFNVLNKYYDLSLIFNDIVRATTTTCLYRIINKIITNQNYYSILKNFINNYKISELLPDTNYNDWEKDKLRRFDILSNLLKPEYLYNINRTYKNIDSLLSISFENLLDEEIVLILNIFNPLNINLVEKYLIIACKNNLLMPIDKLVEYPVKNIRNAFNISLSSTHIIAAAMVSNYNMCNYIDNQYVKKFLKVYVKDKSFSCESLISYIASQIYIRVINPNFQNIKHINRQKLNKFKSKYSSYITQDFFNKELKNQLNRRYESEFEDEDEEEY